MSKNKTAIFAFRGDPMCFIHVLLNGLDLHEKGHEGIIILEGEALNLVGPMAKQDYGLYGLYRKAKEAGIIYGACRACSAKLKVTDDIEGEGIPYLDDMAGHPSMSAFIEKGYRVITL